MVELPERTLPGAVSLFASKRRGSSEEYATCRKQGPLFAKGDCGWIAGGGGKALEETSAAVNYLPTTNTAI